MAEVVEGVHFSVVLVHPFAVLEVGDVFLHVGHYFVDVLSFGHDWH